MFREQFDDDFPHLIKPAHIAKVWGSIQAGYKKYFAQLLIPQDDLGLAGLADIGKTVKTTKSPEKDPAPLVEGFKEAIVAFEKVSPRYKEFFTDDAMEEYADQPGSFKAMLSKGVPVIQSTVNSHQSELLEWHKRFNATKSPALLDMFGNLMDFFHEYVSSTKNKAFAKFDELEDFKFEPIEDDEECRISGVIGMGIKSTVIFHQSPIFFPSRDRYSLLGLYLLSDCDYFGLPTKSSEFVMYNPDQRLPDGTIYSAHNFWYPYALFTLYCLRLYRELKKDMSALGTELDDHYRFVYTGHFLDQVCSLEKAKIRTFLAHDVPRQRRND